MLDLLSVSGVISSCETFSVSSGLCLAALGEEEALPWAFPTGKLQCTAGRQQWHCSLALWAALLHPFPASSHKSPAPILPHLTPGWKRTILGLVWAGMQQLSRLSPCVGNLLAPSWDLVCLPASQAGVHPCLGECQRCPRPLSVLQVWKHSALAQHRESHCFELNDVLHICLEIILWAHEVCAIKNQQ